MSKVTNFLPFHLNRYVRYFLSPSSIMSTLFPEQIKLEQ